MKKLLMTAAAFLAFVAPTLAADKMSAAGVPSGIWCETAEKGESDSWMFFTRGKKKCDRDQDSGLILILKANGDYILTGPGDEMVCKVNPKSYFKGWADYNCITYGGRVMKSKRTIKFITADDRLGMNIP
jgi:hypothetical protein